MEATSIAEPTQEEKEMYFQMAKKSYREKVAHLEEASTKNLEFQKSFDVTAESVAHHKASGNFALASAFIWSKVSSVNPISIDDSAKVNFEGQAWGVGLGGGDIWMGGWLANANVLNGDVKFQFVTHPAVTEISFYKNGTCVGVLAGGGLNVQLGSMGGSGTFSKA
ncbi:hypothetical protein CRI94_16505 [Longibacter salinarum]|uniref:Uncharacterized protein n=1 Tax=Longibacter salinarum TaxID=1850348 RepID=A0A2A8CTJ1_9BACT|nr:hypothetical protein [Longibacter salinarum]PEN11189.1 hypothetical protein CRI94_16505 [Longibacter salinarum]